MPNDSLATQSYENIPNDLEEAAKEYARNYIPFDQCDLRDILRVFKAGAEWMKAKMMDDIKLAYGKVSMNPFDCSEAFEELLNKINAL